MSRICRLASLFACAFALLFAGATSAPFTPGNLVVMRFGNGAAALSSAATPVFLDEYTTAGVLVQSIAVPATGATALTVSGNATSEGRLRKSLNGLSLVFSAYKVDAGTTPITTVVPATIPRAIGTVNLSGVVSTAATLNDAGGNPRSAVTVDGTAFWQAGSVNGARYCLLNGTSSIQLSATPTNLRTLGIFDADGPGPGPPQLYCSSASGTFLGVSQIGSGMPTTSGQTTTQLAGFPITGSHSNYDFWFADANTVYVADDGSTANGGGVQKWTFNGVTWSLQYTFTDTGLPQGLTGVKVGSTVTLFVTSAGRLTTIVDGGAAAPLSLLASAATNTVFRGIAFVPDNTAPALNPISSPQNVNEESLLTFTATANDPDAGQTLTFSLDAGAPSGASITTGGVFTWTPTEAQGPGPYSVTVRVTDNGSPNLSSSQLVNINVAEVNTAPTIDPISDRIETELVAMSLTAVGHDTDLPANTLTYSLAPGFPSGMTIHPTSGQINWTPSEAQGPGDYPVTVRVSDGTASATEPFSVHVDEANVAPTLDSIGNQTATEYIEMTIDADGHDTDEPAQTLTYSLSPYAPGMTINSSTGVITFTPDESQGGNDYPCTVHVSDGTLEATASFSVHVNEANQAPYFNPTITDRIETEMVAMSLTASGHDGDTPAQTLTYSLDVGFPSGMTINSTSGQIDWTPSESQGPGDYTVTVRVSDGTDSATDEFNIHVNEANTAPTIDPISDRIEIELVAMSLVSVGHDTDVPANTLTYSLTVFPSGMTINPTSGQIDWTPTEAQGPGDYPVTVKVSDGTDFATEDFNVHVDEANVAPTIDDIIDQNVDELTLLSVTATGHDTDLPANTLTYSLTASPSGMSIVPSTGVISWTPTEADGPGDYPVTVEVSDGTLSASDSFSVHVNEVNVAPTIDPIADRIEVELVAMSLTAVGHDTDVPTQTLTYSLDAGFPSGMTINPTTGAISWTPTEAQGPGNYPVTVRVSDGTASATEAFDVFVAESNVAPTIDPIVDDQYGTEHVLFTITAVGHDTDIPTQTLTYQLKISPTGMTINPSTGVISWTPSETQGGIDHPVSVEVKDGQYGATETFTVHVTETNQEPVLDPVGDWNVTVNNELTFTATASDSDLPAQTLMFSLDGEPAGATISSTGDFSWTPDTVGDYTFDVVVTDGVAEDRETITVHVVSELSATAAVTVELANVHLPISTTVTRWLQVTVGGTGGANSPITTDVLAAFTDADGPGGNPASAYFNVLLPPGQGAALSRISVKDPLHTVRKNIALTWNGGNSYSATFTGPNALISGDANNDNAADIVDFALFAGLFGTSVGADTAINQAGPHPDWSLDGWVLTADYTFIYVYFLTAGDSLPGNYSVNPKPRKVVTTKELLQIGVTQAQKMDRNNDGWVTFDEIQAYLANR